MSAEIEPSVVAQRNKLTIVGVILAVVGLAFSVYTAIHHLSLKSGAAGDFACNINQTFNCDAVAMSSYSEFMGIPLGVWGAAYFLGLILILLVSKFIPKNAHDCWQGYAALVALGFIVSVVLAAISVTVIGAICLACTGIYITCLVQLLALLIYRGAVSGPVSFGAIFNGSLVGAVGVIATVVIFQFAAPSLQTSNHPDLPEGADNNQSRLLPTAQDIPIHKTPYSGLGEDFRKGNDDAKVTIVEFADFECPACAGAAEIMKQVNQKYGDQVLIVFKNYPLDVACNPELQQPIHKSACQTAKYARCAGEFDKFWPFHDYAFQNQRSLGEASLRAYALTLGIPEEGLDRCLSNSDLVAKIQDDIKVGSAAGVNGTPTIFINGRRYEGPRTLDAVSGEIDRLLN